MAKELFIVAFNVQSRNPGYDGAAEVKKSTTGRSLGAAQEPLTGLRGQVFSALVCEVEAETPEEAILVAQKAYGSGGTNFGGGGGGTGALAKSFDTGCAHAAKKGEWKNL